MAKKTKLSPLATAIGATMVASLASLPLASASSNPFSMNDLGSGYKVAEQGKCGGDKKGKKDGNCGGDMKDSKDMKDGKCGSKMKKEGKCGGDKKGKKDGNCGEGKCGGKK